MIPGIRGPRRAVAGDTAEVRDLTHAAYAKWIPIIGREPRPMTADYSAAIRDHLVDVLEDEFGIAALIEMIPAKDHLLIENVAVRENLQGRGLATYLMAHAEETARKHGLANIRLYTNAAFAENIAFYPRRGYSETARIPLPDGGTMVHFAKAVS